MTDSTAKAPRMHLVLRGDPGGDVTQKRNGQLIDTVQRAASGSAVDKSLGRTRTFELQRHRRPLDRGRLVTIGGGLNHMNLLPSDPMISYGNLLLCRFTVGTSGLAARPSQRRRSHRSSTVARYPTCASP